MTLTRFSSSLTLAVILLSLCGQARAQLTQDTLVVTVQAGDTVYSLSRRAGLSMEEFMNLNHLSSPDLKLGQEVILRQQPIHTVRAGDTLSGLAKQYGLSLEALRVANILPADDRIAIGQMLIIPTNSTDSLAKMESTKSDVLASTSEKAPTDKERADNKSDTDTEKPREKPKSLAMPTLGNNWRQNAQALMGVPYLWGGTTFAGLDCSAFVLHVLAPVGVKLPRVSYEQAKVGIPVNSKDLQPGDLVFFDIHGKGTVDHVGIYMGNNTFANANSYRGQVAVDKLFDNYWKPRFVGARRVLPEKLMAAH